MSICRKAVSLSIVLAAFHLAAFAKAANAPQTAQQVMERVIKATGATPPDATVDTLKAGDPNTVVTGVATTFMDTYSVLEQAVASGKNLIITHEPTFYNHLDDQKVVGESDAVQKQKLDYIQQHHLVVWRFHDTWHMRQPDGILEGMVAEFKWKAYQSKTDPHLFTLPAQTLDDLAKDLESRTGSHSVRVVGDPKMRVMHVALLPGASGEEKQVKYLERDDVEVLVAGEAREWETVEYAQDASAEGRTKALILLGHEASEEAGMQNCADWLKSVLPDLSVQFIPDGDPFEHTSALAGLHK